jgi:hypothetical protein
VNLRWRFAVLKILLQFFVFFCIMKFNKSPRCASSNTATCLLLKNHIQLMAYSSLKWEGQVQRFQWLQISNTYLNNVVSHTISYIKGIVKRDFEVFFGINQYILSLSCFPSGECSLAFHILFVYRIFFFLRLSVVSLHCELIWATRLSLLGFGSPILRILTVRSFKSVN